MNINYVVDLTKNLPKIVKTPHPAQAEQMAI